MRSSLKFFLYRVVRFLFGKRIALLFFAQNYVSNPLLKFPRNEWCWCGSRKKSKNCHLPKAARFVLAEDERKLKLTEYVKLIQSRQ